MENMEIVTMLDSDPEGISARGERLEHFENYSKNKQHFCFFFSDFRMSKCSSARMFVGVKFSKLGPHHLELYFSSITRY